MCKIQEIKAQLTAVTQMLCWADKPKIQYYGKDAGSTDMSNNKLFIQHCVNLVTLFLMLQLVGLEVTLHILLHRHTVCLNLNKPFSHSVPQFYLLKMGVRLPYLKLVISEAWKLQGEGPFEYGENIYI